MPISSTAHITGRGTVIIGTLQSGTLKKGDIIEIKGFDTEIKTVASDIQVFKESVKQVFKFYTCISFSFSSKFYRNLLL